MNCTNCTWPYVSLCREGTCISASPEHVAVIIFAFAGFLHSAMWWRKVSCHADPEGVLIVPNNGIALLYVLVHIIGAIAMLLIGTSAVPMSSASDRSAYDRRVTNWVLGVTSRWSCAVVFGVCCECRSRERVQLAPVPE